MDLRQVSPLLPTFHRATPNAVHNTRIRRYTRHHLVATVMDERHYLLVPASEVTPEDLKLMRLNWESEETQ